MRNLLKTTSYVLVLVGALNWGLVGLFDFDLVATIFGEMTTLTELFISWWLICNNIACNDLH